MAHNPNMKAKIDFSKVKGIKDIKLVLEVLQIEFNGPIPENMQHFVVAIAEKKAVINFTKVKTVKDIKLILESLKMVLNPDKVPDDMKHMIEIYDANAPVKTFLDTHEVLYD